jgi:hypothetical protein
MEEPPPSTEGVRATRGYERAPFSLLKLSQAAHHRPEEEELARARGLAITDCVQA